MSILRDHVRIERKIFMKIHSIFVYICSGPVLILRDPGHVECKTQNLYKKHIHEYSVHSMRPWPRKMKKSSQRASHKVKQKRGTPTIFM